MATVWMRAKLIKLKAQQAEERLERRMMDACYTGRPVAPDNAPAFRRAETPADRQARDARRNAPLKRAPKVRPATLVQTGIFDRDAAAAFKCETRIIRNGVVVA